MNALAKLHIAGEDSTFFGWAEQLEFHGSNPETGRHALVIEDDPLMADLLRLYLLQLGYRSVDVARGALSAIAAVCKRDPDLLVADIVLDDGNNGMEVARRILHRSSVPLVFVSASPVLAKHELRAAIVDKKELSPASLSAAIQEAREFC